VTAGSDVEEADWADTAPGMSVAADASRTLRSRMETDSMGKTPPGLNWATRALMRGV
jgi:hypothetical protein